MATTRSLYDILGVPQEATPDAVRKAYKRKALQTHPDKLPQGAPEYQKRLAEAHFRDVCTAFDILSDPAKRRVYDNGLNYLRSRAQHEEVQNKLARERQEWARQAEIRQKERMKARTEEMRATAQKHQENLHQAELRYREKMRMLEQQLQQSKEKMQKSGDAIRRASPAVDVTVNSRLSDADTYALAEDILKEMRKVNPEWETRRQAAMKVCQ
ncbi:DnaJ-domain-containing protein [Cristinia sonorae]|uniref:DnaJ-domain-containing protein n=1 Tax=Cristinia sonorae TaxID=1940300 RepID=A0A8K0XMK4_9AGAR|nr:DnaJ-domain-containing protein [Cristinia sonorae]